MTVATDNGVYTVTNIHLFYTCEKISGELVNDYVFVS